MLLNGVSIDVENPKADAEGILNVYPEWYITSSVEQVSSTSHYKKLHKPDSLALLSVIYT